LDSLFVFDVRPNIMGVGRCCYVYKIFLTIGNVALRDFAIITLGVQNLFCVLM